MAFKINESKQVSKWVKYEFGEEKHVSEFKIRGIKYKPYLIAHERIQNNVNVHGLNLEVSENEEYTQQEMIFKIVADHLIEDWKDVDIEVDGEIKSIGFDKQIAFDMMRFGGDDGIKLWDFIITNARKIQDDADNYKAEILGKSENSTSGQNTEASEKPKTQRQSKTQSTKL